MQVRVNPEQLQTFCKRHGIQRLAFFGSVLRDDFDEESDIDVLVEFIPGQEPGLIALAGMEIELSGILQREADIRTKEDLSEHFRERVVNEAVVQYAA